MGLPAASVTIGNTAAIFQPFPRPMAINGNNYHISILLILVVGKPYLKADKFILLLNCFVISNTVLQIELQ